MTNDFVALQAPGDSEGFVELARSQKGRLFRKQILRMGEGFVHPNNPNKTIQVDEALAKSLQQNFKAGLCPIVQVPVVNDKNEHVEDPNRNIGEVVDVTWDKTGVYAVIDARKQAADLGNTLLGASALMHMNYADTKTGAKKGPTLLHVAVTNRPYITNLEDFEEVVAASASSSADTSDEAPVVMVPASENTEDEMDLDQLLASLKEDHDIDVIALQDELKAKQDAPAADSQELVTALSNVLASATGKSADGALGIKDVADAVIELAEERVELSAKVESLMETNETLLNKDAAAEVDGLIKQGRILPKQREKMIYLSRNDRETFDALLPDDAIVALSEIGVATHDAPADSEKFHEDIERLSALVNDGNKN